ncbi:hypothetical protein [Falsigemmobacter faecalis]|uniref:Uncharacterized protein n=1 Tax=Falsigemmobacter faecalis TaxID=2488730 RepID=A0A3P3DPT4_9RHOB|nr:hypothetical protein [Falsigemmobacter faecalis]RRH76240.1 hypothetical protein EG244_07470 [Falsigemmobacter faecalis]
MTSLSMGLSPVSPVVLGAQIGAGWRPDALSPVFRAGGFDPAAHRLWQEHTGVTPAMAAGQTIGRLRSASGSLLALQPTPAARPLLVRWPKGGRRNLMPGQTEAPSTGVNWDGYGVDLIDGALTEKAVATEHNAFVRQMVPFGPVGTAATISMTARRGAAFVLQIALGSQWFGSAKFANFNLETGTARATGCTTSITPEGEGWLISLTATTTAEPGSGAPFAIALVNNNPEAARVPAYAGIEGRGLQIGRININIGARAGYQRVISATEITETGVPDRWHLLDDGDSLPVVLPAGGYELAFVTHLGAVSYTSVTSDGTAGIDVLRADRLADVLIKAGSLSTPEKAALETYWHAKHTL